jgi:tetratricopeptide (TPR) repeat protein
MTASSIHKDRRLLPRWRYSNDITLTPEHSGSPTHKNQFDPNPNYLASKLNDWNHSKSIATAADVLECGIVIGEFSKIASAAEYLVKNKKRIPPKVFESARFALERQPGKQFQLDLEIESKQDEYDVKKYSELIIRDTKKKTRFQPRNPMAWLDMSRAYAALGQEKKSIEAMENAVRVAPNHRYILRSASRLLVHFEEHEYAHKILLQNERSKFDPWLIAAEIAVALTANRSPMLVKYGKNFLDSVGLKNAHATELLSSLGTLNYYEGNNKLAKRHIQASLEHPTENVVAQASWIYEKLGMKGVSDKALEIPKSYEARCLNNFTNQNWEHAEHEAYKWLLDEPYSTRAAENASFICLALTKNFDLGEKSARIGVQAYPDGPMLLNNLTVALAYRNRVDDAIEQFNKIEMKKIEHSNLYVYIATAGLLSFRMGDIQNGRLYYEKAESIAPSDAKSRVLAFHAREEFRLNHPEKNKIIEKGLKLAKVTNDKVTQHMLSNLAFAPDQQGSSPINELESLSGPFQGSVKPLLFKLKD